MTKRFQNEDSHKYIIVGIWFIKSYNHSSSNHHLIIQPFPFQQGHIALRLKHSAGWHHFSIGVYYFQRNCFRVLWRFGFFEAFPVRWKKYCDEWCMEKIHFHKRKTIRLKDFDYSLPGGYFVTICVQGHACLFENILDEKMQLSPQGLIAQKCWNELPNHFDNVLLDEFIVMPNHVHGIIIITDEINKHRRDLIYQIPHADVINHVPTCAWGLMENTKTTLGKIVRYYKARSTKFIHDAGYINFKWQSRFYSVRK